MNDTDSLQKIVQIRESEKKNAERLHLQSVHIFEQLALKMYNALKKKEATEEAYEMNIQHTVSIDKMEQHTRYIEQLHTSITNMQKEVNDARNVMHEKQEYVTDAYIELKKMEKILEKRKEKEKLYLAKKESAFMDELSIQQFLKQKQGESIV